MLKKLTIKNFKAIQEMTVEFSPLTVLIGENSCGKSTILQAIDFLRSAALRDIPEYLREKGLNFEELKFKPGGADKPVEFIGVFELRTNEGGKNEETENIEWILSIDYVKKWIIKDKVTRCSDNTTLLSFHFDNQPDIPAGIEKFNFQTSILKYFGSEEIDVYLEKLWQFLFFSANFGLLSPEKIRRGKKNPNGQGVGLDGEDLADYIESTIDGDWRMSLTASELLGAQIQIQTADLGAKVEMTADFITDNNKVSIGSSHMSDGLLRIIAFAAIFFESRTKPSPGMIFLDEIENGINPYLTEKIISLMRSTMEKPGRQVIFTTHSPVILNEIKPEEIVFLWKDKNGSVHAKKFFDTEEMKEALEFLNPGEIWENFGKENILSKLGVNAEN